MFKDKIKELRVSNNLSTTEFAEVIGVSKSSVSLYESDRQKPGRKTINNICEAFGVDEEWLFGEDDSAADTKKNTKKPSKKKKSKEKAKDEAVRAGAEAEDEINEVTPEAEDEADEAAESYGEPTAAESETAEELQDASEEEAETETRTGAQEAEGLSEAEEPESKADSEAKAPGEAEETKSGPENSPAETKKPASKKKVEKQSKKAAKANMKGERKMSKKVKYPGLVPPMLFVPYGRAWKRTEDQDAAKEEDNKNSEKKEEYKALRKKLWEQNSDSRKESAKNRKDKWDKNFDLFMEMQETYASYMSEDPFVLPFAPMYSFFPKRLLNHLMELERMSNDYFKEQMEAYEDFCAQRRRVFREAAASVIERSEPDKKEKSEKED